MDSDVPGLERAWREGLLLVFFWFLVFICIAWQLEYKWHVNHHKWNKLTFWCHWRLVFSVRFAPAFSSVWWRYTIWGSTSVATSWLDDVVGCKWVSAMALEHSCNAFNVELFKKRKRRSATCLERPVALQFLSGQWPEILSPLKSVVTCFKPSSWIKMHEGTACMWDFFFHAIHL